MANSNLGNLLSNYIAKVWGLVSVFIFVPIYIHYLGIENYAIIGFNALLLGVVSFADAGMSSAIIKEFSASKSSNFKYSLLREVEKIYIVVCIALVILISISAEYIANHWLKSVTISVSDLSYYVILMGINVTTQLISSIYFGALFGLNKQVKANLFQISWNLSRSALVVWILMLTKPTIEIYFLWQILSNIIYVLVMRMNVMTQLHSTGIILKKNFGGIPKSIKSYIGGMTAIAIISAVNSQADKIVTSSFFELITFGYYNISSTLAQAPIILATPLSLFIFPYFTKYTSLGSFNQIKLEACFEKVSFLLSVLIAPVVLILMFYTKEFLILWTGSKVDISMLSSVIFTSRVLLIGSFFLALQFPLYYLLLSMGKTNYTIYQGIVQIFTGIPLLYYFAENYGFRGIGMSWIIINFGSYVYLNIIVFKHYIKMSFLRFMIQNVVTPIVIITIVAVLLFLIYVNLNSSFYLFCFLTCCISVFLCVVVNNFRNNLGIFDISNIYNFPKN